MQITIENIQIELERKFIKNMHLSVLPPNGRVHISAPFFMPESVIISFVKEKLNWIKKHQEKFKDNQIKQEHQFIDGEIIQVFGKNFTLKVITSKTGNNIAIQDSEIILKIKDNLSVESRKKIFREWYRTILKQRIQERLPFWEQKMNLYCSSWQTKYMTSRWGTCNIKTKKIWINVQLAKLNPDFLDYVIIHELTHLVERNHNKHFYEFVSLYCENWKTIQKNMNCNIL